MKIIFLDIDGVLNSNSFFASNHNQVVDLYKKDKYDNSNVEFLIQRQMMDIDFSKLELLRMVINETDAKIVVISSWKKMDIFPYIAERLIELGIPVVGYTIDSGSNRGMGIKEYLKSHVVENWLVLDDDVFDDYDEEIMDHLVKTSFYDDGLQNKHCEKMIKKLKK